MKKLLVLLFAVCLMAIPLTSHAFGDSYYGGDGGDAYAEGGTGVGIGVGVGIGGGAEVDNYNTNVNTNMIGVGVDTTDINVNDVDVRNTNVIGQGQDQSQGQMQGQLQGQSQSSVNDNSNKGNKQVITIEDKRNLTTIAGPMTTGRLTETEQMRGFHNDVWLPGESMSISEAKALAPDVGYLWGTSTTVKVLNKYNATTHIDPGTGKDKVCIVNFRGNYGTKGFECQGRVNEIAMSHGGKFFKVLDMGYEISQKSWNIGLGGSGTAAGLHGKAEASQAGGSAGSGTQYGTCKFKARPYITILVTR